MGEAVTTWVSCQKSERSSNAETVIKCPKDVWLYRLPGKSKWEEPRNLQQASWHVSGVWQNGILVKKADYYSVHFQ